MSQISDMSDSDSDSDSGSGIGVKRKNSDSDSQRSNDTIFSKNNKYVKKPFIEPDESILKKGIVPKSVNSTIPQQPPLDKGYTMDASKDAKYSETHAKTGAPLEAKLSRQQQNSFYNKEARLKVVENDAKERPEIIALFEEWEKDNPPPKSRVTIDENQNTEGTSNRGTLEGTLTVEEKRIQKSKVVADKVSDILFELLKDIPPEEVNTKIDELIANASRVNKSLKYSDKLTVRQVNNLKNAGLFDDALNKTIEKINNYKTSNTAAAAYTKGIIDIDIDKDKLSSWLFGTTTEGGYSRSKTIKRSKKSKKRRSSKKLTKRIRSLKQSKKRSKKRRSSKDFV